MFIALLLSNVAGAAPSCVAPFLVDYTFANGARWQLCWAETSTEGIVLSDVWYTPVGGVETLVLGQLNIAEIHISYDDATSDFFDVSVFGMGGTKLQDLTSADCPGGTLHANAGKNVLCQLVEDRGYAYRFQAAAAQGEELSLFSDSQFVHYNFVVRYTFRDDGGIEAGLGLTGELAKFTANPLFGWDLGGGTLGANHVHAAWWRIDFDLGGSADDVVEEMTFPGSGKPKRPLQTTTFTTEAARIYKPEQFAFWRVVDPLLLNDDGHPMSYELQPSSDAIFRGNLAEPWTANDVYITESNPCELYATNNPAAGGCATDVSAFVNGETLTDVVLWAVSSFHHVPRDEDEPHMPIHWLGLHLEPRDWTAENPIP